MFTHLVCYRPGVRVVNGLILSAGADSVVHAWRLVVDSCGDGNDEAQVSPLSLPHSQPACPGARMLGSCVVEVADVSCLDAKYSE